MVFERKSPGKDAFTGELITRINDNTRRIRIIEQRLDGIGSRIDALNQKIIDEMDSLKKGFDRIFVDVKEISDNLTKIRAEILKINKNLDKTARKAEVKELESLLDLYNPIKSKFVTMDQVKRFIEEKVEEKQ